MLHDLLKFAIWHKLKQDKIWYDVQEVHVLLQHTHMLEIWLVWDLTVPLVTDLIILLVAT